MRSFLSNFEDKKTEIDKYFNFVDFLESYILEEGKTLKYHLNGKTVATKIEDIEQKMLRANCYLMLYNLVEGSITESIDAIFDVLSIQNVHCKYLTHAYKKIWINYQECLVKITAESSNKADPKNHSKNKVNKALSEILNRIEFFKILPVTDKDGNIVKNYNAYLKVIDSTDISGNIDARKIRDTLVKKYDFYQQPTDFDKIPTHVTLFLMDLEKKYGYMESDELTEWQKKRKELLKLECNELVVIKNIRNQLAHGEIGFAAVATETGHSIEDLINIKKNIFMYLEFILLNINDFIEKEGFKIPVKIK